MGWCGLLPVEADAVRTCAEDPLKAASCVKRLIAQSCEVCGPRSFPALNLANVAKIEVNPPRKRPKRNATLLSPVA